MVLYMTQERSTNAHVKLEIIGFAQSVLPASFNQSLLPALPDLLSLIVFASKVINLYTSGGFRPIHDFRFHKYLTI